MIIILTGTNGAGKGTMLKFFKDKSFMHYSMSGFIIQEVRRRNLEVNRDNTRKVANDLRERNGPSYISRTLYEYALQTGGNIVIEAMRCPGELEPFLNQSGVHILGIDADVKTRYRRAQKHKDLLDRVTFKKFKEQDKNECSGVESWDMNILKCLGLAEKVFYNNGTTEELHRKIAQWFIMKDSHPL